MLNKKQKIAANYYIKTKNKYESLLKAGYSEKYANKCDLFFEKEKIKEYIRKEETSQKPDPTNEIISYLTKVMRGEETDATATQRIKAAEMLSKHYGLDKEKQKEDKVIPVIIYDDISHNNT